MSVREGSADPDPSSPWLGGLLDDQVLARNVLDASRASMGTDISPVDHLNIRNFASRVIHLFEYRKSLQAYLSEKMGVVAPNLASLIGDTVGARLISHAGSLTNLSKYPASTVQILGAEKALFRALKTKGNTPKYGLIYHSTFIGRAGTKNKGRISRFLANKCSIASRIDCFSDAPSTAFGEVLRGQVEERLAFYETGSNPTKNADAMAKALAAAKAEIGDLAADDAPMDVDEPVKEKKKKRKSEVAEVEGEVDEAEAKRLKKQARKSGASGDVSGGVDEAEAKRLRKAEKAAKKAKKEAKEAQKGSA